MQEKVAEEVDRVRRLRLDDGDEPVAHGARDGRLDVVRHEATVGKM